VVSRAYNSGIYLLILALIVFATTVSAQIGGSGWISDSVTFNVQSPTNAPQDERYWFTSSIYHCLVFSNDGSFEVGNTNKPRTEQRFTPDYTSGEIQYQSMEMVPSNENSYCVFQIHTGDAESDAYGSTTFMLFWFTNNNGSAWDYSGTELVKHLGNQWFQLNVDHNLVNDTVKVWINKTLVWTQEDNGAGDFYFKDGAYEQAHNPTLEMDTYVTNILMWTTSGTNPTTPSITGYSFKGTNVVFSGVYGQANESFFVRMSTNILAPVTNWTSIATDVFNADGTFNFTNPVNPLRPRQFYRIQLSIPP